MSHTGPIGINALSAAILFAPSITRSTHYIRNASQTTAGPINQFNCTDATVGDKCTFFCDYVNLDTPVIYHFDCGNAGECDVQCVEQECLLNGLVQANGSNHLNVFSSGIQCLDTATINLPSAGNATFSTAGSKGLTAAMINAGANTQNILIDCTEETELKDECKDLAVHAETAQYLQIRASGVTEIGGPKGKVEVWCPQNSAYSGPEIAPCIFDVRSGAILENVEIYTLNGMPRDVWIKVRNDNITTVKNIDITCTDLGIDTLTRIEYPFNGTDACWNTHAPTTEPTTDPTTHPTVGPTANPSISPSQVTGAPSLSPSANPSGDPSASPSVPPTKSPSTDTLAPSGSPTVSPMVGSVSTTNSPTARPLILTVTSTSTPTVAPNDDNQGGEDTDTDGHGNSNSAASDFVGPTTNNTLRIVLACALLIICTCSIVGLLVWRKLRKYRKNVDKMTANQSASETPQGAKVAAVRRVGSASANEADLMARDTGPANENAAGAVIQLTANTRGIRTGKQSVDAPYAQVDVQSEQGNEEEKDDEEGDDEDADEINIKISSETPAGGPRYVLKVTAGNLSNQLPAVMGVVPDGAQSVSRDSDETDLFAAGPANDGVDTTTMTHAHGLNTDTVNHNNMNNNRMQMDRHMNVPHDQHAQVQDPEDDELDPFDAVSVGNDLPAERPSKIYSVNSLAVAADQYNAASSFTGASINELPSEHNYPDDDDDSGDDVIGDNESMYAVTTTHR